MDTLLRCNKMDKNFVSVSLCSSILALLVVGSVATSNNDLAKDREKCTNQLVGLATCLPYVGGNAKTPTMDCCSGLQQVLKTSKECLCVLVKDRNDANLGLKINATLALGLPQKCRSSNYDVSECPALLHLAPNSTDAKVFEDFVKGAKAASKNTTSNVADSENGTNSSSHKESSTTNEKSEGTRGNLFKIEMALCLVIIATILSLP